MVVIQSHPGRTKTSDTQKNHSNANAACFTVEQDRGKQTNTPTNVAPTILAHESMKYVHVFTAVKMKQAKKIMQRNKALRH